MPSIYKAFQQDMREWRQKQAQVRETGVAIPSDVGEVYALLRRWMRDQYHRQQVARTRRRKAAMGLGEWHERWMTATRRCYVKAVDPVVTDQSMRRFNRHMDWLKRLHAAKCEAYTRQF